MQVPLRILTELVTRKFPLCFGLASMQFFAVAQFPTASGADRVVSLSANESNRGANFNVQIEHAIIALQGGCGTVLIPAGTFNQTSPITKPRCVNFKGAGPLATVINVTSGGAGIVVADSGAPWEYADGSIEDLTLSGPGFGVGIYFGGDPTGVLSPPLSFGDHQNVNRLRIQNWTSGIQYGNSGFQTTVFETVITNNATGVYFPADVGVHNSGEALKFIACDFQNNSLMAINQLSYSEMFFVLGSFDYNTTVGNIGKADFFGVHFEQHAGRFITVTAPFEPSVNLDGGWMQLTDNYGTTPELIYVDSTLNPQLRIAGTFLNVTIGQSLAQVVNWHGGSGNSVLDISGIPYHPSAPVLTNVACNWYGCNIVDTDAGIRIYNGSNLTLSTGGTLTVGSLQTSQSGVDGAGAFVGNYLGWGDVMGDWAGLRLDSTTARTTPCYFGPGDFNCFGNSATFSVVNSTSGFQLNGRAGYTGRVTCPVGQHLNSLTVQGGIITAAPSCN